MNFPNASQCSQDSLPAVHGLGLATDITIGLTQFNNDTYHAMRVCCAPNSVNLVMECTLWCLLEDTSIFDEDLGDLSEGEIMDGFTDCLERNLENRSLLVTSAQKGGAGLGRRPLRVLDLGMLMCLVLALMQVVS
ncbi:hypothetical protein ACJ41O_003136 [Fusarium nematophilum]